MIILDENLDEPIVKMIRKKYSNTISIRESNPGIDDQEIAHLASIYQAVIVTEDKDFGDLVFHYGYTGFSVVFLRFGKKERDKITTLLLKILENHYPSKQSLFITITANKIRIKRL